MEESEDPVELRERKPNLRFNDFRHVILPDKPSPEIFGHVENLKYVFEYRYFWHEGRRKDGQFTVRVYDSDGKQHPITKPEILIREFEKQTGLHNPTFAHKETSMRAFGDIPHKVRFTKTIYEEKNIFASFKVSLWCPTKAKRHNVLLRFPECTLCNRSGHRYQSCSPEIGKACVEFVYLKRSD